MQGPRQPSHRAVHLLEGIQLATPPKRAPEDDASEDKPESNDVETRPQASKNRPRGRLRDAIAWCRRHMRFLGPGLIASAAYACHRALFLQRSSRDFADISILGIIAQISLREPPMDINCCLSSCCQA